MNTPELPPLPKPDTHCFDEDTGKDVWSHSPAQTQAYAIAAIEAQGVPMVADFDQLQAMQVEWHAVSHDNSITSEAKFQRVYKAAMLASAPPAPQAEDDSAASVNDTNAVLAGRYFELLKVVEQYEKSGVTCQTFRHFISEPCAECNSPGICGKQTKTQPLSDAQALEIFNDLEKFMYQIEDEEMADEHLAGQSLQFILARVAKAHRIKE